MSTLIVEIVPILNIKEHPNADKLEIAEVKGWECIVKKDDFKVGDYALYIPIDSQLPADVENILFPPESKIKLSKGRIKSKGRYCCKTCGREY